MIGGEPVPRRDLFSNKDADAWEEQFHMLFYVLHMSPDRIAEIDYGFDPDDPNAFLVCSWAYEIHSTFPRVDVRAMIEAAR
ncbi:hypothetical protein [Mesorhizobium denitrificans]|uniref:Uncharacterized protein n=1 Tax=Mesorhizobium denitrificans TaxID=2294114 RepID=A0A371XK66_9HYPH|nr:hypothetical protein [Mesorhizobium denitrificans]RFC69620.1 hypothetical protein DY251_02540 [Mesorhizobium denitrificans]